ncbi:hypothetical protein [Comamonas serinivorans]|uniref:hypothetical protein n=1 Tax=Comamonas serinivorans TaxID=1082851 RepID=UPI0012F80841|nr:hypothetical protein [Comamonas serinivorans]
MSGTLLSQAARITAHAVHEHGAEDGEQVQLWHQISMKRRFTMSTLQPKKPGAVEGTGVPGEPGLRRAGEAPSLSRELFSALILVRKLLA